MWGAWLPGGEGVGAGNNQVLVGGVTLLGCNNHSARVLAHCPYTPSLLDA